MPHVEFHGSIRENHSHSTANMAAVVGNKYFWWRDIKCLTACLEAIEEFTYLGI
jgi:hypothetical protein